jgi:hypothetical protein
VTTPPDLLRPHAEVAYAAELAALAAGDDRPRPPRWRLSPQAVSTYLLGGTAPDGTPVTPKYIGPRRVVEIAIGSLATDRALLLLGVPGTAKTWVSEHLAAAVSGDSTCLVQGTSGTPEEALRYGWNYARLLADGPSEAALVPSPVMRAMRQGSIVRVEELTRIPSDVQDALITVLSEKTLPSAASTSSPPPMTGTRASTSCPRHCAAGSTPSCCRCRPTSTTRSRSSRAGSPTSAAHWTSRRSRRPSRRSAGS